MSYGCVIYTAAVHVVSDLTMRQVHLDAILTRVLELCCGGGWVGFGSLLLELSQLVIALRLIMSGDVELNPGPLDGEQLFSCILTSLGGSGM